MIRLIRRVLIVTVSLLIAAPCGQTWGQSKLPKVGVLTISEASEWLKPFGRRLRELGWIEGENVQIEYRNAGGVPSDYAAPLAELIGMKVDVLFPIGPAAVRAAFAATRQVPIVAHDLETDPMFMPFAEEGGLFAYGPEMAPTAERCAELVAKVLGGAKPGDLPIERPTKFEFVLNLKAAQELRLHVPQTVMLRADRVIR